MPIHTGTEAGKTMETAAASLWWDMESCPLPSPIDPYIVTSMGPALFDKFNIINVKEAPDGCRPLNDCHFSAYEFFSQTETELFQTLINNRIRLLQFPPGTSNEIEKMMMVDVLLWAMDTPPPANIIFIVGNVDFSYVFQKLRQRSYNVFLVCPSVSEMPPGMCGGVNACLEWLSFLRSLQSEDQHSHFPGGNSVNDHTFSITALPASSTSIHNRETEESKKAPGFKYSREKLLSLRPSVSGGWDRTCDFLPTVSDGWDSTYNFLLDETASSPVQPAPRFQGHFKTKKPRSPVSSASSTEEKKSASLEDFKAWLTLVVNDKKQAEQGYNISPVRVDFEKATGKILDEKFLGFSKIINLVEDCKDIAVIKEEKQGCHLAFPVKPNEPKNPMSSSGVSNPNPNKNIKSKEKRKLERNAKRKPQASAEDFREFICHMLLAGEFSQGCLMSRLPQRFEEHTGKFLDVEHLGYKKMSELVASYSHLVSVGGAGPGPIRIFPSGFVRVPVPNLCPNSNTTKLPSINTGCDPNNLKAKVEADRPSSGGSDQELLKNRAWEENIFKEQLPYMNSEREWLPSVATDSRASVSFSPGYREANTPAVQGYSIKSCSSSPSGGSQVNEWEGQSSNAIGETTSFHRELEGSNFIKQHVATLQWENSDPIEDSISAEHLMAESMQNMRLMKENTFFCGEPSIHGDILGLPDSIPPPSQSPSSELQAAYKNPLADPIQSRSRAESSAFCPEDLRYGIGLDCKQNEQNTNRAGCEERSVTRSVSSTESII